MGEYNNATSELLLVVVYFKLFINAAGSVNFGIPCFIVIHVLIKEAELHTKY